MSKTTKEIIRCIFYMFAILACGTVFLIAIEAIKNAHQQHPIMVTIGLLTGLLGVVIHEWRTIKW